MASRDSNWWFGAVQDASFGPVVMCGLGGVYRRGDEGRELPLMSDEQGGGKGHAPGGQVLSAPPRRPGRGERDIEGSLTRSLSSYHHQQMRQDLRHRDKSDQGL